MKHKFAMVNVIATRLNISLEGIHDTDLNRICAEANYPIHCHPWSDRLTIIRSLNTFLIERAKRNY